MFSTLPQSVRDEGWQAWENQRMQQEDLNAPPTVTSHDASDDEMSCLSAADSSTTRRLKLDRLVYGMNLNQMVHLRRIKQKAQRSAHDVRRRKEGANNSHLDDLQNDVSAVISWQTHQTREANGKFGQTVIH